MRWLAKLSGLETDVHRLQHAGLRENLNVDGDNPTQLILELRGPEEPSADFDEPNAAKEAIDAFVDLINGFGKLRWGRSFYGLSESGIRAIDADGSEEEYVFLERAVHHMEPHEFADMVERQGHRRPALPSGWDLVGSMELDSVLATAERHPDVVRVLRLIKLMLVGDDDIDWAVAYAALEIIEHDLHRRGVDGRALGWWSKAERTNFRATANSPEAIGIRARHGKPSGLSEPRITPWEANWFVRRVVARWITLLAEANAD
jgi:hypothetical protein